jgi:DNA repair protein RadC
MVEATKIGIKRKVHMQRPPSTPTKQRSITQVEDRFIKFGLDSLAEYEIVELLFSLTLLNSEYKKQARECIKQFGSLRGLIEASPEELQQCGITPRAILCIRLISEIPVMVLKQRTIGKPVYQSSEAVFDYLYYSMRRLKNEVFKVIHLNSRNQVIKTLDLFNGTLNNASVCPREIVESAVRHRAVSMIFAHNHPSGDPTPSKSDKQLTRDLVFIGSVLQIKVLDHIIIGDDNHFSFAREGLIEKYEDSFLTLRIKAGT